MSLSYSTPEEYYFLHEDDVAQVASPPPYTYYPYTRKLPSTAPDTPVPYNQIPAPHGLFPRSTEQSSPLTSNGTLFLGMYRDEGEDYLDFAGRAASSIPSSSRANAVSSGEPTSISGDRDSESEDENDGDEVDEDMDEVEQREEDVATVHHIRRAAVERLEEIYSNLFLQNRSDPSSTSTRSPNQGQRKRITKLVLRDPHFEDEDDTTGLTSSIATEPVLAALLSRVASASSSSSTSSPSLPPSSNSPPLESTSEEPTSPLSSTSSNIDISISSLRLEDLSLPLLNTSYPEIHCPLTLLIQSPLLRELVLCDVILESDFGGVFGHLGGLRKLELRNVGFEVGLPVSGEFETTRADGDAEGPEAGKKIYLESFRFKNSTDVVDRLLSSFSRHCLAFSKLKELGLDFGSAKARELSGKLVEGCRGEVETIRVCFEQNSDEEDAQPAKNGDIFPTLTNFPALRHLELSCAYDLTSLTPYSSIISFLESRGPVPPGVDVTPVLRGVPIAPPCVGALSGSPSSSSTTTETPLDAVKLIHSILSQTFSKIDDILCSLLPIKTKIQIQVAFDTTVGVETYVRAHEALERKQTEATEKTKSKAISGTEVLVLLQLHEDLHSQFNPPEDDDEDHTSEAEAESVEERETRRLLDLTRRFKALYLPNLSSKHQEVELEVELVDVYDLDEDLDQRTVEDGELSSPESQFPQEQHGYDSDEEDSPSRLHHTHRSSRLASPFLSSSSGSSSSSSDEEDDERSPQRPLCTAIDSDSDDDDEGDDGGEGLVWTSPDGESTVSRIGSTWLVRDPRLPGCTGRTSA